MKMLPEQICHLLQKQSKDAETELIDNQVFSTFLRLLSKIKF